MKVYLIEHAFGDFDGDNSELEAAYTTKEDAELHLKAVYNKLIEYESKNKCENVSIDEIGVGCNRFEKPHSFFTYDYDSWSIEELEISEKPDLSKIEL